MRHMHKEFRNFCFAIASELARQPFWANFKNPLDSSSKTHPMQSLLAVKYKKVDAYVLEVIFVTQRIYFCPLLASELPSLTSLLNF